MQRSCQWSFALTLLLVACAPARVAPPVTAPSSVEPHAFVVRYSAAANAFAIVDQISNWYPEKLEHEYRDAWKERFGISEAVEGQLAAWADVRRRHWNPGPEDESILLGRAKHPDELALAFYGEDDLEGALTRASRLIGQADASILRATFALLKPSLDQLLAESRAFESVIPKLAAQLDDPKVATFVKELTRFYRVSALPRFNVEFVWWPPVESSGASVAGDTLLLRYNPTTQLEEARTSADVALHEVVHFVSLHQPEEQKRALSKAFLAKCPASPDVQPARLFEEPLAVAHQKMFLAQSDPSKFDRERPWYGDPYASILAKLLYEPIVEAHQSGRFLDERLALAAGRECRELSRIRETR